MNKFEPIIKDYPHILHGGDYNPEQWRDTPEIWDEDMRLMKLANCNTFSLGIFAWSALEPEDGVYNFGWLDEIMDKIHNNGGKVILATPSGARPPWLAHKYPSVLRVIDGKRQKYGARHNHCFSSPDYRRKTAEINRKLAERYKDHPALSAWHVSNEFNGYCHCDLCAENFRSWLKKKYNNSLKELNYQWWTSFWSHTYTDWSQIEPPQESGEQGVHGLYTDWLRFTTYMTTDFFKNEIKPLREITPDIPVTANLMAFEYTVDYRVLSKELDFVSYDSYPRWHSNVSDEDTAANAAFIYDINRSYKNKPFILMESTPSLVNWHEYNTLKRPGMHKLSSLQAVAHGSDSVLYFQWRKSRGGTEKFHGAVVDHYGKEDTRVFREVADLGGVLKKLDKIVGTGTKAKAAVIYEWDNHWTLSNAQGFQKDNKKIFETYNKWYKPFWKRGINVDIIGRDDDFTKYDLIVSPMMYVVPDKTVEKIKSYVKNGGKIVCTYMTGMVNENDLCHLGGFPAGELKDVFGLWAEETDTLYPDDFNTVKAKDGKVYKALDYCEIVHSRGANVMAEYTSDFYSGMPALLCNKYGKGEAYYVAFRDDGSLADDIIDKMTGDMEKSFCGMLSDGVTAHSRSDGNCDYVFLQNFTAEERCVTANAEYTDLLSNEKSNGEIKLKPYETKILVK